MQISEFEASLVYKVSSSTARAIQRNPVSKKQKTNKKRKQTGRGWPSRSSMEGEALGLVKVLCPGIGECLWVGRVAAGRGGKG